MSEEQDQDRGNGELEDKLHPKTQQYIKELLSEKHNLNNSTFPHATRLLDEEVSQSKQSGRLKRDTRYVDVLREKTVRVVVKVMIPVKEYPRFNFIGKLLGPKGTSFKRLQEETLCKMSILGRNSMKDKVKEEELRKSCDPKFAHLSEDLHVEISTIAPPSEAYGRISYALNEVKKFLIPDTYDDISQEQYQLANREGGIPPLVGNKYPPPGDSKATVLSILEKARNAMESQPMYPPNPRRSYDQGGYPNRQPEYDGKYSNNRIPPLLDNRRPSPNYRNGNTQGQLYGNR